MPPAKHGRKMALAAPSMIDNVKIARKLGYLDIPDEIVVPLDQALQMQDHKVVLMCTGSQGEPSSIVGRLSAGTNRQFDLKQGDTVVLSSHPIPGNEETISKTINRLLRRGANVIYDSLAPIHVSGHASQEEQKLLLNMVKPKHFLPIHGELRQLRRHGQLAVEVGIPTGMRDRRGEWSDRRTFRRQDQTWRTHPWWLCLRGWAIHRRSGLRHYARARKAGTQRYLPDRHQCG